MHYTHPAPGATPGNDGPQPSRAKRRKLRAILGRSSRNSLVTHLFDAHSPLAGRPHDRVICGAVADWRTVASRVCFCCAEAFPTKEPGAFLAVINERKPRVAGLSGCCRTCWDRLDILDIADHAEVLLQTAIPGGRFEPMEAAR